MKKIIAILLAAAFTATAMVGCTPKETPDNGVESAVKTPASYATRVAEIEERTGTTDADNTVVMKIGDFDISLAEYEYACISTLNQAMQMIYYGYGFEIFEDETFLANIQNAFDVELKMAPAILTKAAEKGIDLTDEEFFEKVSNVYDQLLEENGGSLDELLSEPLSPTMKAYLHFNLIYSLYEKLAETYGSNDEALAKANEVLEKAKAGEDFDALITEYNEDPGMTSAVNGYYFTYGEMVAPFEETSFALADNEISGIVETDYGYHIIKKLPVDDEFKATTEYKNVYDSLSATLEGEELENALAEYVRVKHVLIQFPDTLSLAYADIEASLDSFEIVKVENFDELTAPVHEEITNFVAESKVQFEAMYGAAEEETAPEASEEVVEESGNDETEVTVTEETEETVDETAETTEETEETEETAE